MSKKFPKVNYIGNKEKLAEWIYESLPIKSGSVLDGFSGGNSVSYKLKEKGYEVISNDALYSSFCISKAFIENNSTKLELEEIYDALNEDDYSEIYKNIQWLENRLYFKDEVIELAKLVSYSENLLGYKKYLYLALLRRAMIRKLPYSRMNVNWKNIVKLRDEKYSYEKYGRKRAYHNMSFSYHMLQNIEEYNSAVFSNDCEHISTQMNILDAINKYNDRVDLIYLDPPYPGTMNNYQEFYGIFDKIFDKSIEFEDLTNKKNFHEKFEEIIKASKNAARYLVVSLNSNISPDPEFLFELMAQYGSLEIKSRKHNYQISGKLNKNKNNELLAILKF
ncbi:DNA adenine methylase [Staphylococcus aureus]|uniref:DNA adenine methylase n=1 Tax=Staphylococcus aureus TaxID=1280 RepID=UPI00215C7D47|nr:DNA adenine methylase [Staphylococcus aureus]UVJ31100.1 DNA adenine methylase [Staphylococcus aureus]